jgi:hypothetical protein
MTPEKKVTEIILSMARDKEVTIAVQSVSITGNLVPFYEDSMESSIRRSYISENEKSLLLIYCM